MNFGKTYCINLAYREERWALAQEEFKKINLEYVERFNAIRMMQGFIGCMLSHLAILEKAKDLDRFTIFEDDVKFINDPLSVLKKVDKQLPEWDMLYLGANPQVPIKKYSENLFKLEDSWCTHAMIFNSKKLVNFILENRDEVYRMQKIDLFYAEVVQKKFNVYICNPIIATQMDGKSDVTGRINLYHDLIIEGFNKNTQ